MQIPMTNRCPDIAPPSRASAHAAGFDLRAAVDEPLTLGAGEWRMVPTGIAVAIPPGYEGQVRPRSGLAAKYAVTVLNAPGTIDADYRGEIQVILINHSTKPFVIERGDRIAQLLIAKVEECEFALAESLEDTARGAGGFGSSGVK